MPKKKSVKLVAARFMTDADALLAYEQVIAEASLGDEHLSWSYDYAVIRLYRSFEGLLLGSLSGAINNDTRTVAKHTGISFPAHMSDDACDFLVTNGGYFDFRSRSSLIKELKRFLPGNHYLVKTVKDSQYKDALERLSALRNFAAHNSRQAKTSAKKALGVQRLRSSGAWLKKQNRFGQLVQKLKAMATTLEREAPY